MNPMDRPENWREGKDKCIPKREWVNHGFLRRDIARMRKKGLSYDTICCRLRIPQSLMIRLVSGDLKGRG